MRSTWIAAALVGLACTPAPDGDHRIESALSRVDQVWATPGVRYGRAVAERESTGWFVTSLSIGGDGTLRTLLGNAGELPALRRLVLRGEWDGSPEDWRGLGRLPQLQDLSLPDDCAGETLEAVSGLAHLDSLDLQWCLGLKGGDAVRLKAFQGLRRLVLSVVLSDAALEPIAGLHSLEELKLGSCRVDDASLARLSSLENLRSLEVCELRLERETLPNNLPVLESLIIRHCPSGTGTIDLSGLAGVRSLLLNDVHVTTAAKMRLPATLRCLKLGMDGDIAGLDGAIELVPPLPPDLQVLSLTMPRVPFDDEEKSQYKVWRPGLAWLDRFPALSELTLWNVCMDDLEAVVRTKSLRALALRQTPCGGGSFTVLADAELARLSALPGLESLVVENTAPSSEEYARVVTDAGIGALAGLEHFRRLELTDTPVSPAGLAAICKLTGLEVLRLDLPDEAPGVSVLDILPGMSALTNLKELTLAGPVTDTRLNCLKGLKGLRRLDVSGGGGYTDEGLAALVRSLPELKELVWRPQ